MQLLSEYLPLAAFAIAYFVGGIYAATATLMITMSISVLVVRIHSGKFPRMLTASTALVLLFGAATLVLRDARFIQWKPSIFLWLMSAAFLGSAFIGREPLAQRLMQPALGGINLPRRDWLKVNFSWVAFGVLAGAANILVAYNTSLATWVKVKVFGLTGIMLVFLVAQALWLNARATRLAAPATNS